MKKHIVMIDDDFQVMTPYETALRECEFEVTRFSGETCVDQALEFLRQKSALVDLAVVDIMMPSGEAFDGNDTDEGMKTGIFLLEKLKTDYPSIPLLVLTNVRNDETLGQVARMIPEAKILQKPYCPPFDLANKIENLINRKRNHN